MAKKKSRSKKRRSTVVWIIVWVISGGGIGGFFNPDWPVVGPLVKNVYEKFEQNGLGLGVATGPGGSMTSGQTQVPGQQVPGSGGIPAQPASTQRAPDKLLIASFNIQVFGTSKMAKSDVMSVIVQTIRQFDIVAIQEIRSKDDNILPNLITMLNSNGSRYAYFIGERIGRTVSTEQYAYVYDTNRVEADPNSVGTFGDPADLLHREPMVARFRARTNSPNNAFTFWLVNTHTDPDEVPQEIAALADVFQIMRSARPDEDDVILLGDLNASEFQMGKFTQIPGISWVVQGGVMTNTRQNKAYDNIVFHGPSTNEFTGRWGVFNLESAFGLSREDALRVSDHYPVWAEFKIWEGRPAGHFADRTAAGLR